mmetsp:Transcript_53896/g.167307  ORF Transcript_53896/g.167307 Transcript_53896/m.167307 type:complete len:220 (-) Transcript_53896:543-1202(-)
MPTQSSNARKARKRRLAPAASAGTAKDAQDNANVPWPMRSAEKPAESSRPWIWEPRAHMTMKAAKTAPHESCAVLAGSSRAGVQTKMNMNIDASKQDTTAPRTSTARSRANALTPMAKLHPKEAPEPGLRFSVQSSAINARHTSNTAMAKSNGINGPATWKCPATLVIGFLSTSTSLTNPAVMANMLLPAMPAEKSPLRYLASKPRALCSDTTQLSKTL